MENDFQSNRIKHPNDIGRLAIDLNGVGWANKTLLASMLFLMLPALYLGSQIVFHFKYPLPIYLLFGLVVATLLFVRAMRDPELALCIFIIYAPLSSMVPLSIAPFVNGTNMLIALLFFSHAIQSARTGKPIFNSYPLTGLMAVYAIYSSFSVVTLIAGFGIEAFRENMIDFKSWLDQFFIFFIFVNIIKDTGQARRIVVYLFISLIIVSIYGFDEMLEKAGRSSIDKSRVEGPQGQSNEFGAYLAHASAPLVGIMAVYWTNIRSWALVPYFFVLLKLIITSYSRGAMLGFGVGIFFTALTKGIHYIALGLLASIIVFYQFPQLLPESVVARFNHTIANDASSTQKLDKSTNSRFILWNAAVEITVENPILGAGFNTFKIIKDEYTEQPVREADTHNMYLFISAQMGLPPLILLLIILFKVFWFSRKVYKFHPSKSARAIGLGGVALLSGVGVINIFGSRMLDIATANVLWIYMAVIIRLYVEMNDYYKDKNYLLSSPVTA